MEIKFHIPDEFARRVASDGEDLDRVGLEALALEGYRTGKLSESAVREILGFETRMDVHAFLKRHGVYLQYGLAELEQDIATAETFRRRLHPEKVSGNPRSE